MGIRLMTYQYISYYHMFHKIVYDILYGNIPYCYTVLLPSLDESLLFFKGYPGNRQDRADWNPTTS